MSDLTYFTSESVTEGHPDKVCDQVSDAILDALLAQDPDSRCACEVTVACNRMNIMGEITTKATVDYVAVARETIRRIGYTTPELGFDADSCAVDCHLHTQSPDIALGVDHSLEAKRDGTEAMDNGAGDQGMMFGFACKEAPDYMPLAIHYAHAMNRQLAEVRKNGTLPYLRPDGKGQVTVEYADGKPVRIDTIVLSTQHTADVSMKQLREEVEQNVIRTVFPEELMQNTKIYINPTGRFVVGGPVGDSGLTGRKIIVDTYGGYARHGGAFSGKDATKVDRSAAYMARHIAKNLVAAGYADKCELQLSYAIGVAQPVSIFVETFGTGHASDAEILRHVRDCYDLRPTAIIAYLGLRNPVFSQTAAYGHFGANGADKRWEQLM